MSTLELNSLLNNLISLHKTNTIFDLGCGIGAQSMFLSKNFPAVQFIGLDYNSSHVDFARNRVSDEKIANLRFEEFDILKPVLSGLKKVQQGNSGLVSVHTLCCFKNFEPFFNTVLRFNPKWFVCNSLFYEGPLEVLIHMRDFNSPSPDGSPDSDFNIFSKERVKSHLENFGYKVKYSDFYPESQLPRPSDNKRGTYTISTDFHPRTQFSGPVHLPWSFLIATKL
jgi:SAM-dependent methyltransferase